MAYEKITAEDTNGKGVVGLPDSPQLDTTSMQKKFDELATDVIIPKFNQLIDELEAGGLPVKASDIVAIRINRDGQIEVSTNGTDFAPTASSGHLIIDSTGKILPQRGRLIFNEGTSLEDDPEHDATLISGPKGDKGDQGEQGIQGVQGVQGEAGPPGATGPAGPQGVVGPAGPAGSRGPQGEQGEVGPTGPQGIQGPQGETGLQGPKGDSGVMAPASGMFGLSVDVDGNLYVEYAEDATSITFEYDSATGNLYYLAE